MIKCITATTTGSARPRPDHEDTSGSVAPSRLTKRELSGISLLSDLDNSDPGTSVDLGTGSARKLFTMPKLPSEPLPFPVEQDRADAEAALQASTSTAGPHIPVIGDMASEL